MDLAEIKRDANLHKLHGSVVAIIPNDILKLIKVAEAAKEFTTELETCSLGVNMASYDNLGETLKALDKNQG